MRMTKTQVVDWTVNRVVVCALMRRRLPSRTGQFQLSARLIGFSEGGRDLYCGSKLLVIFLISLCLDLPAQASACDGVWILNALGRPIFAIELRQAAGKMAAAWHRPTAFQIDGNEIRHVTGPIEHRVGTATYIKENEVVILIGEAEPDKLKLSCDRPGYAELSFVDAGFAALPMQRGQLENVSDSWDPEINYTVQRTVDDNLRLKKMYDLDQSARTGNKAIDADTDRQDRERITEVYDLIEKDQLSSADDFYRAAFILQHGNYPKDYLNAHLSAMISLNQGKSSAVWIAVASLDRYLLTTSGKQVIGSQFTDQGYGAKFAPINSNMAAQGLAKRLRLVAIPDR